MLVFFLLTYIYCVFFVSQATSAASEEVSKPPLLAPRHSHAYKIILAEHLAVQPHASVKRAQLQQALMVQVFLMEARSRGYNDISELSNEVILSL